MESRGGRRGLLAVRPGDAACGCGPWPILADRRRRRARQPATGGASGPCESRSMKRRVLVTALLVLAVAVAVPAAAVVYRAQTGLRDARELLAHQLWPQARERLA